jgi:thiamine-monophosphate kinase
LLLGRGDDCAEFMPDSALALSTDLFLENYHFRRSYFEPEEIGHKALAVNLSDLASAGAIPQGFSLGLMCPPDLDPDWLDRMFCGMGKLAAEAAIILTGGDISAAPLLGFSLTVWGGALQAGLAGTANTTPKFAQTASTTSAQTGSTATPFLRRGAEAGDILFVASACSEPGFSNLGLARLGLKELESKGRAALADYPQACAALLRPTPQLAAGRLLAALQKHGHLHCMDVSDGLARDLPRLLAAGKNKRPDFPGADLDLDRESLHPEIRRRYPANEALAEAFSGGDDYCLLCACSPDLFPQVQTALDALRPGVHLQVLGKASSLPGIRWQGKSIDDIWHSSAFDHFG